MKKLFIIIALVGVFALFVSQPSLAWNDAKKIETLLNAGTSESMQAAYTKLNELLKKKGSNASIQTLFGRYHLKRNNYGAAIKAFEAVLKHNHTLTPMVSNELKLASFEAYKQGNIRHAKLLLDHAIKYSHPKKPIQNVAKLYINMGTQARAKRQYTLSEECTDRARVYAQNEFDQQRIAGNYLYLAALNHKAEEMKNNAMKLVGQAKVDEIFPSPRTEVVFEKTYTVADADKNENIRTIEVGKDDLRKGDLIEVIGKLPDNRTYDVAEIEIFRGKNQNPKWVKTKEGYYSKKVEIYPPKGFFYIWMEKGLSITATVKVTGKRKV